jgi:PPOX class probable F420-dependent enzyme
MVIYSALDEKPKSVADVRNLGRVKDIRARPQVTVLVDEWSEDWDELAWVRLEGTARLLEPAAADDAVEHAHAVALLRERYPQYERQHLENRPLIRIAVERVVGWAAKE